MLGVDEKPAACVEVKMAGSSDGELNRDVDGTKNGNDHNLK